MSTTRDVSHIVKFNGQNFPLWKFGFWILLEQHDLVKVVNGEETKPAEVLKVNLNYLSSQMIIQLNFACHR
jgi:hypothetical protein